MSICANGFVTKALSKTSQTIMFVSVLFLFTLLTACGGGGGGTDNNTTTSTSEGTKTSPTVLNFPGSFPNNSSMKANTGVGYYKAVGLIANEDYKLSINTSSDIGLVAYRSSDFSSLYECMTSTTTGSTCTANSAGELYLLAYSTSGPTSDSSFTISMSSMISEGSPTTPKNLTSLLPYTATLPDANFKSFFIVNNLTPGNSYTIGLDDGSDTSIDLRVYQDKFQTQACSATSNVSAKSCTLTTAGSQLWITLKGKGVHILSVTDNGSPTTIFTTEGLSNSPMLLSYTVDGILYSGQVDHTNSYYIIAGLIPNSDYRIVLNNIVSDNVDLNVYSDNSYSTAACVSDYTGTTSERCLVTADNSGSLWLRISGANAIRYLGATYDINVYEYFPDEGDYSNKFILDYATAFPHNGTVDISSYYQITGLQTNTSYLVDVSNYSTLVTTSTSSLNNCYSREQTLGVQRCIVTANDLGQVDLIAKEGTYYSGNSNIGATFTMDIAISPYQSEGSSASPLALNMAPTVSYSGQIGGPSSYYQITGLTAGTAYTLSVAGMIDYQYFYVYQDAASLWGNGYTCQGKNTSCTRQATGTSMWLRIDKGIAINGAAITIDMVSSPYQAEGLVASPVLLTYGTSDLPYSGSTDTTESYYEIQGLNSGTEYALSVNDVVSNNYASIYFYDDVTRLGSTTSGNYICYTSASDGTSKFCRSTPISTSLWVMVQGSTSTGAQGAFYNLNVTLSPIAESVTIDASINGTFPRASSTNQLKSDYSVTNLLPNQLYYVSINNMSANVDLAVNATSYFTDSTCDLQTGTTDEQCLVATGINGQLNIRAKGSNTLYGAFFDLNIVQGPTNEGTALAPIELAHNTGSGYTTRASQVGLSSSYYKITGLTADRLYEIKLTALTGDVDLYIAGNANFESFGIQCSSTIAGTADKRCGGLADTGGALYVQVVDSVNTGAEFTLEVLDGLTPEGSSTAGQAITYTGALTSVNGQVDITNSYYEISGLDPKASYTVSVIGMTDNTQLYVYTDTAYSVLSCSSGLSGTQDDSCTATLPNGGAVGTAKLYIKVLGSTTVAGATYSLQISI